MEQDQQDGFFISWFKLTLLGLGIGAVLAGLFAIKRTVFGNTVTAFELELIVVATVLAVYVCRFLDKRVTRSKTDPAVSRTQPEYCEWADCCKNAYAKTGSFDSWISYKQEIGKQLRITSILEDKTVNYHRAILITRGLVAEPGVTGLRADLDDWCRLILTPSGYRGLGIGIVMESDGDLKPTTEPLLALVDYKARSPATVQWIVWFNPRTKSAVGVHMPIEGQTTQCFVDVCVKLQQNEFELECCERPAEGFLKFALMLQKKTPWWLHILTP